MLKCKVDFGKYRKCPIYAFFMTYNTTLCHLTVRLVICEPYYFILQAYQIKIWQDADTNKTPVHPWHTLFFLTYAGQTLRYRAVTLKAANIWKWFKDTTVNLHQLCYINYSEIIILRPLLSHFPSVQHHEGVHNGLCTLHVYSFNPADTTLRLNPFLLEVNTTGKKWIIYWER